MATYCGVVVPWGIDMVDGEEQWALLGCNTGQHERELPVEGRHLCWFAGRAELSTILIMT